MPKIHSRWLDLTESFSFTGLVAVPTPTSGGSAANKSYVDAALIAATGTGLGAATAFVTEQIAYTDFTNKVIALSNPVGSYSDVVAFLFGGDIFEYGVDYTVRFVGTQAYICIDTTSTAPSGSFNGGDGSNPSVGAVNIQVGDVIKALYSTIGTPGGANSTSSVDAGTTGNQATNTSYTDIGFDFNNVLNGADITHSTITANDNFLINITGGYLISYELCGDSTVNAAAKTRVRINDTSVITQSIFDSTVASESEHPTRTFIANLNAGDFITLQALSTNSGNWVSGSCHFSITNLDGQMGPQGIAGPQGAGGGLHGTGCTQTASNSNAGGFDTLASGVQGFAIGTLTTASGACSFAGGSGTTASGDNAHAEGNGSTATNVNSHAEGDGCNATGISSHSEGSGTGAGGNSSHSEGNTSFANADYSHVEGQFNTTNGIASHAEGFSTQTNGQGAHSEGNNSNAWSDGMHAHCSIQPAFGANPGPAQFVRFTMPCHTTDATSAFLQGSPTIRSGSGFAAKILVLGKEAAGAGGGYLAEEYFVYFDDTGALNPAIPTPSSHLFGGSNTDTWTVAITMSGAQLVITVTGAAATDIGWTATVLASEINL